MTQGWDYTNHQYRDLAVDESARLHVAAGPSYVGLSADEKPYASDLPVGVTFAESDTGRVFVWDGAAWRLRTESDAVVQVLGLLLLELQRIRLIVETVTS